MYLKRLSIQGFKSFANETNLDFVPPHDGRFSITAVVGPNGSGKSNVVDAIRWVMGEQSIKTLRGKKSEDVIFGGSANRGALGACAVTMVLDNADNRAGVDYPEIVITRKLYRSGESEYLINGNPVRLLDIHLLLARAQFGQHSYSVVGQGTIDRLLVVSPIERKEFLDEASGIKEYQIKEHQASLKLARTRENMDQVERLLAEVEPHLKMLARQVKKLEKRQEVEADLRAAQSSYYGSLAVNGKREADRLVKELSRVENDYRGAFSELTALQTELAELARATTRQEVFGALQDKHQLAVREKNEWERQLAILSGRLQAAYGEIGKQNLGWLEKKAGEIKEDIEAQRTEEDRIKTEEERVMARIADIERRVSVLQGEKDSLTVSLSQTQTKVWQEQSERQYLEMSGLIAVRAVLDHRAELGKIYGPLAELGEVPEEYRLALEVAAGQHLSSVVVADEDVAKRAIEFLRQEKMGVATFLPLSKITGRRPGPDINDALGQSGVVGLAVDQVKFDSKFAEIFSFVFGDILLVEDLATARRLGIGRWRMVTLEGDVVEKKGVMRGGWRGRRKGLTFTRKLVTDTTGEAGDWQARSVRLGEELKAVEEKLGTTNREWSEAKTELDSKRAKRDLVLTALTTREKELAEIQKELDMASMSPEEYSAHLSVLTEERKKIEKEIESAGKKVLVIDSEIRSFNDKEEEKKRRVFALQENMQTSQNRVNEIMAERNEIKIQLAKLETKEEDLGNEISNELGVSLSSLLERAGEPVSADELTGLLDTIQKLKYQLSLIGGIDEDVTAEYATAKERYDFLTGQLTDLKKATEDLSTLVMELTEIMKKKRAASFKKIKKEFDRYFKILFGGGEATLEELYGDPAATPENIEAQMNEETSVEPAVQPETKKKEQVLIGIDIAACPPGKKIKNLSALSGGERTLTSIALICAILNCNPSPFVVMDEVEAALDETNTMRFANIMAELARQSQFIVITHNRVTMHAADALYGVTMGTEGISKILSVELKDVSATAGR